ncbi:adenosylcobinamide-GDP ribazoletransferase [Pseudalkalibacillus hwajinpoensis]|uniref:adenosylcobinamide-GDP ribazoletransferase n=1 Tax=Guptibacillus hwajinpoensis TaxID=208199 RepID=UPI00325A96D8
MSWWQGFLINLQFFTIIPVRREIPMEQKQLKRSIQTFPVLGILQGILSAALLYALIEWSPFSTLAAAFILWFFMIALTGGIHLDGWMDASDAFFSYQDLEKRLEIMKDPRTGAFGVLSVIVLLSARFLFIYEIAHQAGAISYVLIATIPFFSKSVMGAFLVMIAPAKEEGLAFFFQKAVQRSCLWSYPVYFLLAAGVMFAVSIETLLYFLVLTGVTLLVAWLMKRKITTWFRGITGDVLGASVEGVEVFVWMTLWLLYYFVMG